MFKTGEHVSKVGDGICRIREVSEMAFGGKEKRVYYVLEPLSRAGSKVFVPVDKSDSLREVISREEALDLIEKFPELPPILVENEKQREQQYQGAMQSNSPEQWARVVKTIWFRKEKRIAEGKKITSMDDRYFKAAESCLYEELGLVLGKSRKAVISLIKTAAGK